MPFAISQHETLAPAHLSACPAMDKPTAPCAINEVSMRSVIIAVIDRKTAIPSALAK